MYTFVLAIHIIVVIGLLALILIQRGRSGGLVEALGGVESIFGTKTSGLFVKLTVTLAILFFVTSISLAYLSKQRSKSLFETLPVREEAGENKEETALAVQEEAPAQAEPAATAPQADENSK